jgi:hypothetical protein
VTQDRVRHNDVPTLRDISSGVIIVAHQEDTMPLRRALQEEGFPIEEVRGPYTPEQTRYSAIMRCFVNHANAWRIAATRERPTIVVEADFVPVRDFGQLPAPVVPGQSENSLGYLCACRPQVWDLVRPDLARGHAGATVALLISPKIAAMLLQFFEEEIATNPLGQYSPFDSKLGFWLNARGVDSYLTYRHYGEHGGVANTEHARAGLGRPHQADVLQEALAFLPMYAQGSNMKLWATRARARIWGLLRLLSGRYLAWHDYRRSQAWPIVRYAIGRYILRSQPHD